MLQLLASYGASGCTAGNTAGTVIGGDSSAAGAIYVNSVHPPASPSASAGPAGQ